ncbi:taurine catabolism dioxygenase [Alternaria alternata]|nr:taurine catabolism dioxygenase [Alternaria alternata]
MPGTVTSSAPFRTIVVKQLHSTFGAEVVGADFTNMTNEQFDEIKQAMAKYSVLVFRKANLSDDEHVAFSRKLGELHDLKLHVKNHRFKHLELFDVGNVDDDGKPFAVDSPRTLFGRGNAVFHNDSSFNRQRASWSILRAVKLPPPGTGGETEYADSLAAWDNLDEELKGELLKRELVGVHSFLQLRKLGAPEYFADVDPYSQPMARHKIVSTHEPSGRKTLYVGNYLHHIEKPDGTPLPEEENAALMEKLIGHVTRPENVLRLEWYDNGDMIAWDNVSTLHRATGGIYEGKFTRDMRRTTVKDDSPEGWGVNSTEKVLATDTVNLSSLNYFTK